MPITRTSSLPNLAIPPLQPGIHHPDDTHIDQKSGILSKAKSAPSAWISHKVHDQSMLKSIEIHPHRGLVTLIATDRIPLGELTQTDKRDLERAITSIVIAYNKAVSTYDSSDDPAITIHENHVIGDGEIYRDAAIPRIANEWDYDRYHTLGVPFASNGKMNPHYHLEYRGGGIDRDQLEGILRPLHHLGIAVAGREVLTREDLDAILEKLPYGRGLAPTVADVDENRSKLPSELDTPELRVKARDNIRGEFISLSSANTERLVGSHVFNMHMNSFRQHEPLLECYRDGSAISLADDLQRAESLELFSSDASLNEIVEVQISFRKAIDQLDQLDSEVEFDMLKKRLQSAIDLIAENLRKSS